MSTNFSPNSVLARMVAVALYGILSLWLIDMLTTARPSTSFTESTLPTLIPRILTSEFFCRPCPAASKLALSGHVLSNAPKLHETPMKTVPAMITSAMSPLMTLRRRRVRSISRASSSQADGVTAAPEDEREDEVQQHDCDDAQPDGTTHCHADPSRTATRVVPVIAVDQS